MIVVERVYKSFDQPVLRGISLTAGEGEILGIIGPPAAGKTVLLRAVAALEQVDAGSITVFGREVVGASPREIRQLRGRIGMLSQNVALFDSMSVFENVAFPLRRLAKLSEREIEGRVRDELDRLGLSGHEGHLPSGLSGGQKRRVGLARAAIMRPALLLYDEPAAGLDPVSTARVFAMIRDQRRRFGACIVVISSDVDRLLLAVDEVAMVQRGRVLFQGAPGELATCPIAEVRRFVEGSDAS